MDEKLPGLSQAIPAVQTKIWQHPPLSLLADDFGGKADRGDNARLVRGSNRYRDHTQSQLSQLHSLGPVAQ